MLISSIGVSSCLSCASTYTQERDVRPSEFAAKWQTASAQLSERAASQEHWRDLCALLDEPTPSSDPTGDIYTFEKHVKKAGTGETGYADVFRAFGIINK